MKRLCCLLFIFFVPMAACNHGSQVPLADPVPVDAQMVYFESQSWEPGGGFARLTYWRDGRSEVVTRGLGPVQPQVQANLLPADEVRRRFEEAFTAGIVSIKEFKANYVDGGGTVLGYEIDGRPFKKTIPIFPREATGSTDYIRFQRIKAAFQGVVPQI